MKLYYRKEHNRKMKEVCKQLDQCQQCPLMQWVNKLPDKYLQSTTVPVYVRDECPYCYERFNAQTTIETQVLTAKKDPPLDQLFTAGLRWLINYHMPICHPTLNGMRPSPSLKRRSELDTVAKIKYYISERCTLARQIYRDWVTARRLQQQQVNQEQ